MIEIKNFYIGNKEKSFCFDEFSNGINIIHSDDNNKGKTIVSQGIFYALGNVPIFPAGFENYNDYYYIVTLSVSDKDITICRKKDSFLVNDGDIRAFESVNSFKRYFHNNIFALPTISSRSIIQVAGLELFFETVFLPQDKRNTSNLFNPGRYGKDDLKEFIFSYMGCANVVDPSIQKTLKIEISNLEEERKVLKKSSKLLKSKKIEASFATYTASKERIDEKIKTIETIKDVLSELTNKRNRLMNKKTKNELLLKEINSLNNELQSGAVVCADCGSKKILYESRESDIKFDIADSDIRSQIKRILSDRIQTLKEDVLDIDAQLLEEKQRLADLLKDEEVSMENLLFYKDEIVDAAKADSRIYEIDSKISDLKAKMERVENQSSQKTQTRESVLQSIVSCMNEFYDYAEPDDPLTIEDLFTKSSVNYSGSQGALFFMSKIFAISKITASEFPIIIDHFRSGELSTFKEKKVIDAFSKLNKQVIFTCTLKEEEKNKYDNLKGVTSISFDAVNKFHLLDEKYNDKFRTILKSISIDLALQ